MRSVAGYSLRAIRGNDAGMLCAADVLREISNWLRSKGEINESGSSITLADGRNAELCQCSMTNSKGTLTESRLTEPIPQGWLETRIGVAESEGEVAVSLGLSVGSPEPAPLVFDIRCPRLIQSLLASPSPWRCGNSPVSTAPLNFAGDEGGDQFIYLAWATNRSVPIVAISDEYGAVLHPRIAESIALDLAGLAVVAVLDAEASWRVTARKRKEWSCYGGAIRLYWPHLESLTSPFSHPLWTPRRLLYGVLDTDAAASRIRKQFRRRVLGQSAFSISEPPVFAELRWEGRREELETLRQKAVAGVNYQALADEYFEVAAKATEQLQEKEEQIRSLEEAVSNLQIALQWNHLPHDEVGPEEDVPPATVEEAVLTAIDRFEGRLTFGTAVNDGLRTLRPDAGPPDKILNYLSVLADFTEAKRSDRGLGTSDIFWFRDRGVVCSGESETKRQSPKSKQARTWDDSFGALRLFESHLKPNEGTSPDRCVRIYYMYDDERRVTIVGWVGAHPSV